MTPLGSEGLNVRNAQNTNPDSIIARLPYDKYVEVLRMENGWYWVQWHEVEGWITARTDLAVVVKFEATATQTLVPVEPSQIPSTIRVPQAQSGNGGLDMVRYCRDRYQADFTSQQSNALSLTCVQNGVKLILNYDSMCFDVYGDARPIGAITDIFDTTSVSCQPTGQGGFHTGILPARYDDVRTGDGGIHVGNWCKHHDFPSFNFSSNGVDIAKTGWYCINGEKTRQVDWEQACLEAYGSDYHHQLLNADELGGHKCVQQENPYVDPGDGKDPRATTPTPVPPINPTPGPVVGPGDGYHPVGCPPALAARLSVGAQGRSTDGGIPLKMRQAPGKTAIQVGTLPNGAVFTVKAGPNCADAMNWWFIDLNGTLGWVEEGINGVYYVEPFNSPQQDTFIDEVSCQDGSGVSISSETSKPTFVSFIETKYWCTEYVISRYPKLQQCWQGYPDAGKWDDWARDKNLTPSKKDCGLSLNAPNNGHWVDLSTVQAGDIVVWEGHCGPAIDPRGHVGLVRRIEIPPKSYPKGEKFIGPLEGVLFVDEANGLGGKEVRENVPHALWGCMSFIRLPNNLK